MRGLRRMVRTAGAVAAVFISSAISVRSSSAQTTECKSDDGVAVELSGTKTEVEFKCGTGYTAGFSPKDVTHVHTTDATPPVDSVPLSSIVPRGKLIQGTDGVYTLAASHTTVLTGDKTLYYYCKKEEAKYCKITVTVKARDIIPAVTCKQAAGERVIMNGDEHVIKFACGSSYTELLPAKDSAYIGNGDKQARLVDLYPGATLKKDTGANGADHVYTLSISERQSNKILRFLCKKGASETCEVHITVAKNAPAPTDDQLTPATCNTAKQNVNLTLSAESPGIAFACGLDLPTIDPQETDKVYIKDSTDASSLSTLYKNAGLYTNSAVAAHVYFLYIPYREDKKELQYNCKKDTKKCTVNITVEPNKGVIPVCRDPVKGAHLSYEDFFDNIKFKCDAAFPNIVPSNVATVYPEDPSIDPKTEAVSLENLYGGAKLVSDGDSKSPTFTLTIPPHLPRSFDNIYYQCKKADNTRCTVRIRIAKKEQKMRTCTAGKDEKVTITGAGEIVRFKCDTGMSLRPNDLKEVYDNANSKCSTTAKLTDLVPQAVFEVDKKDEKGSVITFKELPNKEQALCYACAAEETTPPAAVSFRAPQTATQCKVMIDVKSAAIGLTAQTLVGHALTLMTLAGVVIVAL